MAYCARQFCKEEFVKHIHGAIAQQHLNIAFQVPKGLVGNRLVKRFIIYSKYALPEGKKKSQGKTDPITANKKT